MANTSIGEVVIYWQDKEYLLRPSFSAIHSIGNYNEKAGACGDAVHYCKLNLMPSVSLLLACTSVIQSCCADFIPVELTGDFRLSASGSKILYKSGSMHYSDICVLANHLMKWGLYGEPSQERLRYAEVAPRRSREQKELDITEYVGLACAPSGLGMGISAAWGLTMREFQIAYDAQFPLTQKQKDLIPPDAATEARLMAQINAAREKVKSMPKKKAVKLNGER